VHTPENEQYFAQLYETWQNMLYLKPAVVNEENAYNKFSADIPSRSKYRAMQLYNGAKQLRL
jgi:transmembrane sensor